ncbi:SusC/RagA family TonB-linked outer membrane protein [Bacteroidia bacterium]|nr:SusC/RagA family TonB-linked outer membrane protein [Bacteroidia bacterium]
MSVTLKSNPSVGTSTDLEGAFQLTVPDGKQVLIFTYLGMETQELQAKADLFVTLAPDSKILNEVVVTGYQKIDRKLFTGSASVVKAADAKMDGVADVSRMLQGKAAGVQLTNVSGTFGAAPKLRVRGATSIFGNSSPLWVVDGVILDDIVNVSADELSSGNAATLISSAVAGLNADDIESFQILKDASATAIYGSRAMNGVIVITTKRGKKGSASINYTGEFTVRAKPTYSQYDIMNSKDQMAILLELESAGQLSGTDMFLAKDGGVFSKWYQMTDKRDENGNFLVENTPQAKAAYLQQAAMRNTNWFNELFRNTMMQQHSVSISSGSDKSTNYTSLSYFHDPGWTIADNVDRFTFNQNTSYNLSSKLTAGILGNASVRMQKAPGTLDRKVNVVEGEYARDFDINPFSYALNSSRTMDANEFYRRNYADFNIKHEMENNYIDLSALDTKLQVNLSFKPITGLELNALGAVRYAKTTREHRILSGSNMAEAYRAAQNTDILDNNNFLWQNPEYPDSWPVVVLGKGGFYNTQDNSLYNYYARLTGNYIRSFSEDKHIINILAGAEMGNTDRTERYNNGYGYLWGSEIAVSDYRILRKILDAGDTYFGMEQTYNRQVGFFGNGTYSYNGKYTINGTLRMEGTNMMGEVSTARWLPTWNVSASWNAIKESFMRNQKILSNLSFRGTYGLTANSAPEAQAMAVIKAASTYRPFQEDREVVLNYESLANEELTWEKMYETNVGFDMGFLQNRFSISFDAYWRNCFDLIGDIRTTGIGGEHIKKANFADMQTSGYEFTLNTLNIKQEKFSWSTTIIFSYNTNKITNLKSRANVISLVDLDGDKKEGYSQSGLFSIPFAGLDEKGHPQFYDENGEKVYYLNFQEVKKTDFLKYAGQLDPKYVGGIENTFSFRNLKFSFFINYQAGNVIRLFPIFPSTSAASTYNSDAVYSDIDAMTNALNNRWFKPGDEAYTTMPGLPSKYDMQINPELTVAYNAYNFSTERVAKGDFVRLKDITLSYDFSKKLAQKLRLNSLQLRGSVLNLWLIYADKKLNGQDPEFSRSGGVAMPIPRQFTLSLRVGI